LPDKITNTYGDVYGHGGVVWANDGKGLFYVTRDAIQRPYRVYHHVLGADPAQDQLLYEEKDEMYFLLLTQSRSKAYVMVFLLSTTTHECRLMPNDGVTAEFKIFQPRIKGMEYQVEHAGDRFYVITNENAQNFKLMQTPLDQTTKDNWQEVIPHREDVYLTGMDAFEDHIIFYERRDRFKQIRISNTDALSNVHYVEFPKPVYYVLPNNNPKYETDIPRFTYVSLITPKSVVDYNVKTKTWAIIKRDEIPSGYDPAQYESERMYATASDGTQVPMSLVYKK